MSNHEWYELPAKLLRPEFMHLLTTPMLLRFAGFHVNMDLPEVPHVDGIQSSRSDFRSYHVVGYPVRTKHDHGSMQPSYCYAELQMLTICSYESTCFDLYPPQGCSRDTLIGQLSKVFSPGLVSSFNRSAYDNSFRFTIGMGQKRCLNTPGQEVKNHVRRGLYLAYLMRQHLEHPGTVTPAYVHQMLGFEL